MILEFFMSTFTFNIWIELAIIPVITIITVMNVIAERKEEYKSVHKLLDSVLAIAGFWIFYETTSTSQLPNGRVADSEEPDNAEFIISVVSIFAKRTCFAGCSKLRVTGFSPKLAATRMR